jgi:hypothetical protein
MVVAGQNRLANRLEEVWVITGLFYDANIEIMPKGNLEIPDIDVQIINFTSRS